MNLIVYKDNQLVEASYKLTLIEQRLMIYCISKLNPEKPEREQIIRVEDFIKQFSDVDKKSAYNQIKQAINLLGERWIKVKDPKFVEEFRWISAKKYYSDEGSASISFSPEVMPYLCQLEKQFTKYQLRNISAFKRVYSIRLYELLTQYRTLKSRIISVLDLRVAFQLDNKFKVWKDLNKNVISPSVLEINEKSDLLIEYKLIKKGRAVDSIEFSIQEKSKIKRAKINKAIKQVANSQERFNKTEMPKNIQSMLDNIKNNLAK